MLLVEGMLLTRGRGGVEAYVDARGGVELPAMACSDSDLGTNPRGVEGASFEVSLEPLGGVPSLMSGDALGGV